MSSSIPKYIGVFFGSRSPEHDISILTAMRAFEGFCNLPQYRAVPVYIDRRGQWFSGATLGNVSFFQNPRAEDNLKPHAVECLSFEKGTLFLHPHRRLFVRRKPFRIDIAFPCLHGSFGEDGTIQGLFETAGISYVGCGVMASAIAMSKVHTRQIFREADIATVPTAEIVKETFEKNRGAALAEAAKKFAFPLFVKPNALGSSIAVSRVANEKELEWALEVVFQFDTLALVEPAIANIKEVNVGVIGHRELTVSETEEPRFEAAFQTFEEKYVIKGGTIAQSGGKKGKGKSRIPADLPDNVAAELKDAAAKAFRAIGASGISRFDFLVNSQTNEWYLGEINTLPGSLQTHVWAASGIPLPQLIEKLIGFAEERHSQETALLHTFESSVLRQK